MNERLNIALCSATLQGGGAERVLIWLANYWVQQAHQVDLITYEGAGATPFYEVDSDITIHRLNLLETKPKILQIFTRHHRLRQLFKSGNYDIIVAFTDVVNLAVLLATYGLKTPVIISERIDPFSYKLPKIYNYARRWLYPKSSSLVIQTSSVAPFFSWMAPSKIIKIPNPIMPVANQELKKNELEEGEARGGSEKDQHEKCIILHVGRLSLQKGQDVLIQAFALISNDYPQWQLHLYGSGPLAHHLRSLIGRHNLTAQVLLMGMVKNVENVLTQGSIFAFPSRFEGFPNALGEAMSHGLCCIATRCAGNQDLIIDDDTGLLVEVDDVRGLSHQLKKVMDDQVLRHRLGKRAREMARAYDPTLIAKQWDELLHPKTK